MDHRANLRAAYDEAAAARRDAKPLPAWRVAERTAFAARLDPGARVLEVGAGPGHDARWFADQGYDVTAVDLSPAMVARCGAKGLRAHVGEATDPGVPPASADAVWSMSCLLHVPNAELPAALAAIRTALRDGGLFFLGLWGGHGDWEGHVADGRFFSFRTDATLRAALPPDLDVLDFRSLAVGDETYQALTLRRS